MRESTRRLNCLEKKINGTESERITITLGDKTLTFKNKKSIAQAWIKAHVALEEEKNN